MTSVWGTKKLGGYAGVKFTAKQIVESIPNIIKYNLWVEPFSGLGRTANYVNLPKVLNDKSEYANSYCKEHFPESIVENMDFMETINKYDSENTFFLIDPPWQFFIYNDNEMAYCDRKVRLYYEQILNRIETIKGDWFLLSSVDEHEQQNILRKSKWGLIIVDSEKNSIFGNKARTMICSNLFNPNFKQEYIPYIYKAKIKTPHTSMKNNLLCDSCGFLAKDSEQFNLHLARPFHLNLLENTND